MNEPSNWYKLWMCTECLDKYEVCPLICNSKNAEGIPCQGREFVIEKVYCLDKILSYNCFLNCLVGGRRRGKSYSVAKYCVKMYKEKGYKFVWIRRYLTELDEGLDAFKKLGYQYNRKFIWWEEEIPVKGKKKPVIVKHIIGKIATFSTFSRKRGGENRDYHIMVLDEYGDEEIPTTYSNEIYTEELKQFNSLIMTILDQKKFSIVFVLSNNVNRFMPIYQHMGVMWDQEWTYNWQRDAVCHIIEDKDRKLNGKASKWIQSTDYFEYAVHNKPMDYDKDLVESHTLEYLEPEFCFKISNLKDSLRVIKTDSNFTIDYCKNCVHTSKIIDLENAIRFACNQDKDIQMFILEIFMKRSVKYTTPQIKQKIYDWVSDHIILL